MSSGRLVAGRYRLGQPVGRGAMGTVWQAHDELLKRSVAVKEVRLEPAAGPGEPGTGYERTLREARAAARLSHPGVVRVFDVVQEDGRPWIVMELVPGRSLDRVLAENGPLTPAQAAGLGGSVLEALAAAHAAGILHRDVKPGNVLITPDRVVLTDFGIATLACDPSLTQAGMVAGTPGFTAPERIRGQAATPASDLWSLGAMLYAAVEGSGPYDRAGGPAAILAAVTAGPPPQAPSAGPLGPALTALLHPDPAQRPSARAAARMLAMAADRARSGPGPFPGLRPRRMPDAGPAADSATADLQAAAVPAAGGGRDGAEPPFLAPPDYASLRMPDELPEPGPPLPQAAGPGASPADTGGAPGGPGQPGSGAVLTGFPGTGAAPASPPRRRHRLLALAGAAAFLVAGAAAWAVYSQSLGSSPVLTQSPAGGQRLVGHSAATRHGAGQAGHSGSAAGPVAARSAASSGHARPVSTAQPSSPGRPGGGPPPAASASAGPAPPSGYRWVTVTAASLGTTAGFTIAVPDSWQVSQDGLATTAAAGSGPALTVSLSPFRFADPARQARYLEASSVTAGDYPGYRRVYLRLAGFRGLPAGWWRFSWRSGSAGRTGVLEILFTASTTAGPQSCTLSVTAPAAQFPAAESVFAQAVRTFQPTA
ncbi:MAG: protein kinase domain-containing protein [Streptosporangiaceae bacterium]